MTKTRFELLTMLLVLSLVFFLSACDDTPPVKEKAKPAIVKKKITQSPSSAVKPEPVNEPASGRKPLQAKNSKKALAPSMPETAGSISAGSISEESAGKSETAENGIASSPSNTSALFNVGLNEDTKHYDSQGKIDPFRPLIQEQTEANRPVVKAHRPKRILTPLEKIDLSQIRLVAVIQMKNRKIAMVEEASGKGYEVGIGTYIGKNQGRITEIKSDRIVIKELAEDYKGRLKEKMQEIKLNKNDEG